MNKTPKKYYLPIDKNKVIFLSY